MKLLATSMTVKAVDCYPVLMWRKFAIKMINQLLARSGMFQKTKTTRQSTNIEDNKFPYLTTAKDLKTLT